jgi:hypothetical protein
MEGLPYIETARDIDIVGGLPKEDAMKTVNAHSTVEL